jgi:hypothetical protein
MPLESPVLGLPTGQSQFSAVAAPGGTAAKPYLLIDALVHSAHRVAIP